MAAGGANYVLSVFAVGLTLLAAMNGAVIFGEFDGLELQQTLSFGGGCIMTMVGLLILGIQQAKRQKAQASLKVGRTADASEGAANGAESDPTTDPTTDQPVDRRCYFMGILLSCCHLKLWIKMTTPEPTDLRPDRLSPAVDPADLPKGDLAATDVNSTIGAEHFRGGNRTVEVV